MYILVIADKDPDNFVHTLLTLLNCSLCHGVQLCYEKDMDF